MTKIVLALLFASISLVPTLCFANCGTNVGRFVDSAKPAPSAPAAPGKGADSNAGIKR